jgi:hypothetical protein
LQKPVLTKYQWFCATLAAFISCPVESVHCKEKFINYFFCE